MLENYQSKSKVRNSRNKAVVAKVSRNTSTPMKFHQKLLLLQPKFLNLRTYEDICLSEKQRAQLTAPVKAVDQCSFPSNTVTNPKEDLKGITTRSGTAYQGPTIPTSSPKVVELMKYAKINVN
ncbi:hypothetical protein Tco_0773487 [Tanacetum coccineum]|uniref:Reverse transcriptase domain-containing protein n=1 Tax=Tanacetum coccineum TaxID=301880 RepID=A0ABQ4ZN46_9ASTR